MALFGARVWEFLIFLTKFSDSRHVQLSIYTVFQEESESAVRIDQFLHPEEKIKKNQPTRVSISYRKISYYMSPAYFGILDVSSGQYIQFFMRNPIFRSEISNSSVQRSKIRKNDLRKINISQVSLRFSQVFLGFPRFFLGFTRFS